MVWRRVRSSIIGAYTLFSSVSCLPDDLSSCISLNPTEAGMTAYIHGSQWKCAHKILQESHAGKVENHDRVFFATRSAVASVKKSADEIIRLLDKRYALPAKVSCAYRAHQNETHITAVMRFSKIFEGQSAKWTRYSTSGGQGKVVNLDKLPFEKVGISESETEMLIVGEVLNYRYAYSFDHKLFDYVIPEESTHEVVYRESHGSLQMSQGATLPEYVWTFRKKVARVWPRLFAKDMDEDMPKVDKKASLPGLLPGFPFDSFGKNKNKTDDDGEEEEVIAVKHSPITCSMEKIKIYYCPAQDKCVKTCTQCGGDKSIEVQGICYGDKVEKLERGLFFDEAGEEGKIGGNVFWKLRWDTHSVDVAIDDVLVATVKAPERNYMISPPIGVSTISLVAIGYNGKRSEPTPVKVTDSVAGYGNLTAVFEDIAMSKGYIEGKLYVDFKDAEFDELVARAGDEEVVLKYDSGDVKPHGSCVYKISHRKAMKTLDLYFSFQGFLSKEFTSIPITDVYNPGIPSLEATKDKNGTKDMVHVKFKISNVPKTKHRLRLENQENEVLVDLGNKRSYNYKGKPLTSEVYAEAYNEFATAKSNNVTVKDVMLDV